MNFIIGDTASVGLYAGYIFGIITFFLIAFAILILVMGDHTWTHRGAYGLTSAGDNVYALSFFAAGILVGLITLAAMWPLKYEYHHYVSKRGIVENISSRFIREDKATSQRFVIKLTGDPTPYAIDDTRASLLKIGDHVGIKCKKEHQFFQPLDADGWSCRWGA